MESIEFFSFEDQVWYAQGGEQFRLTQNDRPMVRFINQTLEDFYPEAYSALTKIYKGCKPNLNYYQYRIALHFCKCNFSNIDNIPDIKRGSLFNLEHVSCPLRGICQNEGIICHARFKSGISKSEKPVMELLCQGYKHHEIANELCLSIYTIKAHIKHVFARLDIHSEAEFVRYANDHNIFKS